jgi:hypothetical protein
MNLNEEEWYALGEWAILVACVFAVVLFVMRVIQ